jgi:hypothetical protein
VKGDRSEPLERGDFARLCYRLGRTHATGVLTVLVQRQRPEVLILRRGHLITTEHDVTGRAASLRLGRIAAADGAAWSFDGGTAAYPPGASGRQVALAAWARAHLEAQLDASRAERLLTELAGVRISIRPEHVPEPQDETDRRMLAAMTTPRRLDQIWPMARTPRFRLLAFLHFLRSVGGLSLVGVAAEDSAPVARWSEPPSERVIAMRLLGLDGDTSREAIKRAYRRMARALHPDLQPGVSELRRRELEAKLREVTAAYEQLVA